MIQGKLYYFYDARRTTHDARRTTHDAREMCVHGIDFILVLQHRPT